MASQEEIEAAARALHKRNGFVQWERVTELARYAYRNDAKAALEAAERARWQLIETAPKDEDGPFILVIGEGAKIPGVVGWCDEQGWYWLNNMFKSPCKPTHWQRLPSPPESSK